MLNVCIIGSLPEPIGGVSTHCYNLTKELVNYNMNIVFFDTSPYKSKQIPEQIKYYNTNRIRISISSIIRVFLKSDVIIKFFFKLKIYNIKDIFKIIINIIKLYSVSVANNIDLLHSQHSSDRSISPLILSKILNIPIVVTTHTSEFSSGTVKYKKRNAKICNLADSNIFVSKHALKLSKQWGNSNTNSQVIYNGIDTRLFNSKYPIEQIKEQYNIKNEIVILYVGWLTKRKGPQVLLEAISQISSKNIKTFIIGPDHGLEGYLRKKIDSLMLENQVHLLGKVDNKLLKQMFALCDIFVFPTITNDEGFGLVALEAMASESIVLGSRIAAIPEVVKDGESGFLFNPNDAEDLAKKTRMIINKIDIDDFGKKARKYAINNFSWVKMAEETKELYIKVLNKKVVEEKS